MDPSLKVVILISLALASYFLYQSSPSHHFQQRFNEWKQTFSVQYSQSEDSFRQIIFRNTVREVDLHNRNESNSYQMAVNQFSAMTDAQFALVYLKPDSEQNLHILQQREESAVVPKSNLQIDWISQGRVSPVKNQGSCASCWAFSAVAILESFALSKQKVIYLSQQQLVDCSEDYGNSGCYGGFNFNALQYVIEKGITEEKNYPYKSASGPCLRDGGQFKITKMHSLKGCIQLYAAIQLRPFGVTVDATKWRTYGSGIFSNCDKAVNHDVLLVGLTSSYYRIKNSWGTSWGEQGYIRLALGDTCGICLFKSFYVE